MPAASHDASHSGPPADARELAGITLRDWRGGELRLGDVWTVEPALLVFLRHYG